MNESTRLEYGDFQTPPELAEQVCRRLLELGVQPASIVEPTCGTGAFVFAASKVYAKAQRIVGYEVNQPHLNTLRKELAERGNDPRVTVNAADFFTAKWEQELDGLPEPILILGNLPWVTSAVQGVIGGTNLPEKSNFLSFSGLEAITGKANFDISEWMLIEILKWFRRRSGALAILCKTSVARKVLAHAERERAPVQTAAIFCLDAKKQFGVSVDACLLFVAFTRDLKPASYDYQRYESLDSYRSHTVGHRDGLWISDITLFDANRQFLGESAMKWRSGVKHDASPVMEFTKTDDGLINGMGELVAIEPTFLYPLMKGSDVANATRAWRNRYVLVPQKRVGEPTSVVELLAPRTWQYLKDHADALDQRRSKIYRKNPRFSVFGVGDYTFKPWKVAICSLYKDLRFRLVGPVEGKPVAFDDTVYFLGFDKQSEAALAYEQLTARGVTELLSSLIFWDEKRPIKAAVLNRVDWTRVRASAAAA